MENESLVADRQIDVGVVRLSVEPGDAELAVTAELRIAISDGRGQLVSVVSGSAKISMPSASYRARILPQLRTDALVAAVQAMLPKLRAHLRAASERTALDLGADPRRVVRAAGLAPTRLVPSRMVARVLALLAVVAACRSEPVQTACSCTPANVSRTRTLHEDAPMNGVSLLARLRRHRDDVAQGKNPRDIKIGDDELRFAIVEFCQPCGDWVKDRLTIEEMFPLGKLDQATRGVCMGLVLPDGTTAWGDARPQNCR